MADNILTKDRANADLDIAAKEVGGAAKPRRTVQASDGWTPDNSMQLARARRRRRQQQFVAIHTLQH